MMGKFAEGWIVMVGIGLAVSACAETPTGGEIQMAVVAGAYQAEGAYGALTFTTEATEGGVVIDWLARGASLYIDLREDGSTTGRLFVPGGDEDGTDLDADLTGTWTLDGAVVRFQQEADTFVRDMPFVYDDGRLVGDATFAQAVHVELAAR